MNRSLLLLIPALTLLGAACAGNYVAPRGSASAMHLDDDEDRLWREATREQGRLNSSSRMYDAPEVVAYLNNVATKLVSEKPDANWVKLEVKVIKDPHLNAFSYPNGVIYFHTGLLGALENEAQLATVLAHEIVHVLQRHLLQQFRATKNTATILQTMQVLAAPAGAYGAGALLLGSVGAMAAVSGYSQAFESDADALGLEMIVKAGYDPTEAPKTFAHLKRELEAGERKEPFLFGSHPRLAAREANYGRLIETRYAGVQGIRGREAYLAIVSPIILENVLLDISLGRFSLAQHALERYLKHSPRDGEAFYCLGELSRQRSGEGDLAKAQEAYRRALEYNPNLPYPHRGLGLVSLKQGRHSLAAQEFRRYLQLLPDAPDRGYIQDYLRQLSQTEGSRVNDL